MNHFAAVCGGKRSVKRVDFALINGVVVTCGIQILDGMGDDAVEVAARAAAIARGVADPKDGNTIYDRWTRVFTLLFGCVAVPEDKDAPLPEVAEPYFDSAEQILRHLDGERIAYLYAMQRQWQALVSPRPRNMDADEFTKAVFTHAMVGVTSGDLPFFAWHPDLQAAYLITTGHLLINSPLLRSRYGSDSESSATSSSLPSESDGSGDNLLEEALQKGHDAASRRGAFVHAVELTEHAALRGMAKRTAPQSTGIPAPRHRRPAKPGKKRR